MGTDNLSMRESSVVAKSVFLIGSWAHTAGPKEEKHGTPK
jgi:hypothetical protein